MGQKSDMKTGEETFLKKTLLGRDESEIKTDLSQKDLPKDLPRFYMRVRCMDTSVTNTIAEVQYERKTTCNGWSSLGGNPAVAHARDGG